MNFHFFYRCLPAALKIANEKEKKIAHFGFHNVVRPERTHTHTKASGTGHVAVEMKKKINDEYPIPFLRVSGLTLCCTRSLVNA